MVTVSEIAFALSSPTRLTILANVKPNMTFAEIAEAAGIHKQTLTYHAEILEDVGLLVIDKIGTKKYARLRYAEVMIPLGPHRTSRPSP